MPAPRTKVAAGESGFGVLFQDAEAVAGAVGAQYKTLISGPWRTFAIAVGQSGPANITRAKRAIRAISGSAK